MNLPSSGDPSSLIDLLRHPIGEPSLMAPIVSSAHRSLHERGVVVLDGFLRPESVTAMCDECEALDPSAHFAEPFGTPYLGLPDMGVPVGDPRGARLRSALSGGDFESATRVRTTDDERSEAVESVLAGSRVGAERIPMRPGPPMLFGGRHSMHRVTPKAGSLSRYVALLAYDTKSDTDSSELLKLVRYGRLPS